SSLSSQAERCGLWFCKFSRSQTLFGNAILRNSVSHEIFDSLTPCAKQSFAKRRSQTLLGNEGSAKSGRARPRKRAGSWRLPGERQRLPFLGELAGWPLAMLAKYC